MNVLSGGDGEARKMAESGRNSVSVVDHDGASVTAQVIGEGHDSVGGCDHGGADSGGNIDTGVEGAFSIKRIDALAKGTGYLAFDRPQVGSGVRADPICR